MKVVPNFKMVMLWTHVVLAVFIGSVSIAIAQETEVESSEATSEQEVITLEGMVVVGTRAEPRSVLESAVPIDVLPSEDFVKQGGADLPDLLRNLVPSYNVNAQPIADAATVVRPANLRGLAPDHTLLLVNGKRRHRASVIAWLGNGLSDGAQGADLSPIPFIALKQVEVLRDGASAQYGSDAIAGVINLQLKDSYEGGSFEIKPSIFQTGDGLAYALAGNIGLGREDLWTNLSVEYGGVNETDRSIQRDDAAALISAGNTGVGAQTYDGAFLVDLELSYAVIENLGITIGVNNVLNVEPDNVTWSDPDIENFTGAIVGRPFGEYSPYGFGGAFWYTKVGYSF